MCAPSLARDQGRNPDLKQKRVLVSRLQLFAATKPFRIVNFVRGPNRLLREFATRQRANDTYVRALLSAFPSTVLMLFRDLRNGWTSLLNFHSNGYQCNTYHYIGIVSRGQVEYDGRIEKRRKRST